MVLTFALATQIIVLFAAPVGIALWFNRRWGLSWILFFGGALAFVAAWVVTSFLQLGGVLGLVASSITEIGALYLVYRYQLKTVTTEREAIMVGTGLGGIELILMSVLALLTLLQMTPLRDATDSAIIELAAQLKNIPEEQVVSGDIDEVRDLVDSYWNRSALEPILMVLQPLSFLPIQMALAIITLGALVQSNLRLLLGAMSIHFLTRVIPAYGAYYVGTILGIFLALLFGGVAIWFLYRLGPTIRQQNTNALAARRTTPSKTS
jgi:uncharacterized membrane protein YhfC